MALREHRRRLGLTQHEVAQALVRLAWQCDKKGVGVNANMVSKWERGAKHPREIYRELLCLLYDTTEDDLGLNRAGPQLAVDLCDGSTEEVERRQALSLGGGVVLTAALEPWELARALAVSSIDAKTLEWMEATTVGFFEAYAATTPSRLLASVQNQLQATMRLLGDPQPLDFHKRLLAMSGQLSALMGCLSFDLYGPDGAGVWFCLARQVAQEVNDYALGAYVLANQSLHAINLGHPTEALELAQGAHDAAVGSANAWLHSWCAGLEARAHASRQNTVASHEAIERAEQVIDQARPDERRPGIDFFTRSRLAHYRGTCTYCSANQEALNPSCWKR